MNHHDQINTGRRPRAPIVFGGDASASASIQEEPLLDFSRLVGGLKRQWPIIAACVVLALTLATIYLLVTPPRYTATAVLMLDTRRVQLLQQQSVIRELSYDAPAVESQVEILRSEAVALSVINKLGLADDREFTDRAPSIFGWVTLAIKPLAIWQESESLAPPTREEQVRLAVGYFQDNLLVERVGRSYVVEISFQSFDKEKATRIANAIGEAYIADQLQAKYTATKRAADWLKTRIGELRQEAESAERETIDFRNRNNLTDTGGKLLTDQQLAEVSTQLYVAKAQTAEARARLDRVLDIEQRGIEDAAVGDSLRNTVLNQLQQQYIEAAKREADFSSRYGTDHIAAVNLRKEMQRIQEVSKAEMNRISQSYKSEYEIARSREQALQASLDRLTLTTADMREAQVELRQLESSANTYRTLHENFLQRFVEATQQQSFPDTEARLITEAASTRKTHPWTALVLGIAGLIGTGAGCGAAFVREGMDRVFRTARQVEQTLGLECLGVIPAVAKPSSQMQLEVPPISRTGQQVITEDLGIGRQVVLAPFSRFSETIRAIKVAADTSAAVRNIKVVGVTSALPKEGKSTVASNLAQLMAHSGRRVLLIDADLRNPLLSRRIAPHAQRGIIEVLNRAEKLSEVVWCDPVTGLDFLPAVCNTPVAHANELLASERMADIIAVAKDLYEYIVVDLPPIAPIVDAKAAAHHIDAFVFIIEWGETSPEAIFEALGSAEVIHSKILGVVLNKANVAKLKKLEAYKGETYHQYYRS